ncbi:hypothetical protein [Blastomonas sp.]|uniref:hypothetical protein n=1 Tax=Blastomonas sp. TaxID=1909299 RepID=UPI0035938EE1
MKTDRTQAFAVTQDDDALLARAAEQATGAAALPVLIRQTLAPATAIALREDDLGLAGGFAASLAEQLHEALWPDQADIDVTQISERVVLQCQATTRLCFARAIEARLCHNAPFIGMLSAELPARVEAEVGDAQDEIAAAAMSVIVAQSRFLANAAAYRIDLDELPPEILAGLVWRMVGWLQTTQGGDPVALRNAAEPLLARFDERLGRPNRMLRFCHLLELPRAGDAWAMADNGPSLLFAMLARTSGLGFDMLIDMARDAGLARLVIVLRACDVPVDKIVQVLADLALLGATPTEALPDSAAVANVTADDAARLVAGWRNAALLA